ncbi:hypothetical protein BV22DRAFT_769913 [Leucogyrophana mollusca]|uniref:Uncharacterized protein n=1 Tax=Leucogyrophana mollusca TaxID=85980 RepID=A0ACB8B5F4_9AGAM|nr:hypothetical protein BV22DRAFT_769913 [Leucogyrophana mollusca]
MFNPKVARCGARFVSPRYNGTGHICLAKLGTGCPFGSCRSPCFSRCKGDHRLNGGRELAKPYWQLPRDRDSSGSEALEDIRRLEQPTETRNHRGPGRWPPVSVAHNENHWHADVVHSALYPSQHTGLRSILTSRHTCQQFHDDLLIRHQSRYRRPPWLVSR